MCPILIDKCWPQIDAKLVSLKDHQFYGIVGELCVWQQIVQCVPPGRRKTMLFYCLHLLGNLLPIYTIRPNYLFFCILRFRISQNDGLYLLLPPKIEKKSVIKQKYFHMIFLQVSGDFFFSIFLCSSTIHLWSLVQSRC